MKYYKFISIFANLVLIFDFFMLGFHISTGRIGETWFTDVLNIALMLCCLWSLKFAKRGHSILKDLEDLYDELESQDSNLHLARFDYDNSIGYYYVYKLANRYAIYKHSNNKDSAFIVRVFPFDPSDEESEKNAEKQADELYNMITDNDTLFNK